MGKVWSSDRFRLYGIGELAQLAPPDWLIRGLFETRSFMVLFGQPETFKTFLALAWALSIAAGREWFGRRVKQGPVVYVYAEGGRAVLRRVQAWMIANRVSAVPDAFFCLNAVELTSENDRGSLLEHIHSTCPNPALIVFDTLNRCFSGEENSATDMGQLVRAAQELQTRGATVLFVHHAGKPRENGSVTERGSSALRGAADVMVRVERSKDAVKVSCEKQKDSPRFDPIALRPQEIELGRDEEGELITSCVLVPTLGPAVPTAGLDQLDREALLILRALSLLPLARGRVAEWRKLAQTLVGHEISERTFARRVSDLKELEAVVQIPRRRGFYTVDWDVLAKCHLAATGRPTPGANQHAATATPLEGWQEAALAEAEFEEWAEAAWQDDHTQPLQ